MANEISGFIEISGGRVDKKREKSFPLPKKNIYLFNFFHPRLLLLPPLQQSLLFDTPVDGGGYRETVVAPSTVRRSRHASGEDGLAALSAAAFLKLDEGS